MSNAYDTPSLNLFFVRLNIGTRRPACWALTPILAVCMRRSSERGYVGDNVNESRAESEARMNEVVSDEPYPFLRRRW